MSGTKKKPDGTGNGSGSSCDPLRRRKRSEEDKELQDMLDFIEHQPPRRPRLRSRPRSRSLVLPTTSTTTAATTQGLKTMRRNPTQRRLRTLLAMVKRPKTRAVLNLVHLGRSCWTGVTISTPGRASRPARPRADQTRSPSSAAKMCHSIRIIMTI